MRELQTGGSRRQRGPWRCGHGKLRTADVWTRSDCAAPMHTELGPSDGLRRRMDEAQTVLVEASWRTVDAWMEQERSDAAV